MKEHVLQSTMIYQQIASGHSDTSIILRTGHSSVDTLDLYHNLQCLEGFKQHLFIYNSTFTKLPSTKARLQPFYDVLSGRPKPDPSVSSAFPSYSTPNLSALKSYHHSSSSSTGHQIQHSLDVAPTTNVEALSKELVGAVTVTINYNYFKSSCF